MGKIWINETELEYQPGENIIQAAQRAGAEIPHYCWHPDLSVVASCRMCLVETGERKPDGSIAMQPRLSPACQTPTKPDLVIQTGTEKVRKWQGMALELLLLNHPLDCSICDQAGECYLQDYTYKYGKAHSRLDEPKVQRMDKYHIGDQIALFTDRCVMCTRCVRFTREYSGTAELQVVARGSTEEIDVFPGQPVTTSWPETWSTCVRSVRCAAKTSSTRSASGGLSTRRAFANVAAPAAASLSIKAITKFTAFDHVRTRTPKVALCATKVGSASSSFMQKTDCSRP